MRKLFLTLMLAVAMIAVSPTDGNAADNYAVIGGTWDIEKGQFGAGVDAWQDLGLGRFFVGEQGYIGEGKTADASGGFGVGPGYWIFNNSTFQVGVMVQGISAFMASAEGETGLKWGGAVVGTASYVLPSTWPAYAVTLIARRSFIDEGETNLLIGASFKTN